MWNTEAHDRYLDDVSTIRFSKNVSDALTALNGKEEKKRMSNIDEECFNKIQMGEFILR